MSITFSGVEWDYNNLSGIAYDSETLLEPYATWFYLITGAFNYEKEIVNLGLTDGSESSSIHLQRENVVKFKDYSHRVVNRKNEDNLTLGDDYERSVKRKDIEPINLTETYNRDFYRSTKEDTLYTLDECRYIEYDASQQTTITVEQTELSGALTVFDFELSTTPLNDNNFTSWCEDNCPVNYDEMRPFIPGEYEYTDAYVGFRLTVPPTSGRFGVVHSTVYVDVEDTVEKGTAEAVGGGLTTVTFSKRFYTSPQIMTSLIYTTENCYIEVSEVTKEYFKFGLKSISNGQYLAGEINWLADGY